MSATAKSEKRTVRVRDAARRLGLSPATIRSYCRDGFVGELDSLTGWYWLSEEEIEWLRDPEHRPPIGRPPRT